MPAVFFPRVGHSANIIRHRNLHAASWAQPKPCCITRSHLVDSTACRSGILFRVQVAIERPAGDSDRRADLCDAVRMIGKERLGHRHLRRRSQLLRPAPLPTACACRQSHLHPLADAVSLELGAMGEPSTDAPRVTPRSAMDGTQRSVKVGSTPTEHPHRVSSVGSIGVAGLRVQYFPFRQSTPRTSRHRSHRKTTAC